MKTLQFILTVSLALLVGTMFGIWVGFNPAGLSAVAYVEQQQNMIRSFNILLPAMGAICILLTLMLAFLYEKRLSVPLSLVRIGSIPDCRGSDHGISESADQRDRHNVERAGAPAQLDALA